MASRSSRLKEADEVFPLFDFFLDFVTGGCNFCLCGEDSTDEGEDSAPGGSIKGPAQGAVSGFVGRCIPPTVYSFLAAPARRVEDQAEEEEQTCRMKRKQVKPLVPLQPCRTCSVPSGWLCNRKCWCLFIYKPDLITSVTLLGTFVGMGFRYEGRKLPRNTSSQSVYIGM